MKASICLIFILLTGINFSSYSQESGMQKRGILSEPQDQKQHHNFYRKPLRLDSLKADQVSQVQAAYKAALRSVIADTSLTDTGKQAKISVLIEVKNQRLRSLLSPIQQNIVPSTEPQPPKSSERR